MESDLCTLSPKNIVVKNADDTNVLVPVDSNIGLLQEFNHVNQWAKDNTRTHQKMRQRTSTIYDDIARISKY